MMHITRDVGRAGFRESVLLLAALLPGWWAVLAVLPFPAAIWVALGRARDAGWSVDRELSVFRWRRLWPRLAAALGVDPIGFTGEPMPLERQMADAGEIWPEVVRRHGLRDLSIDTLASWWHTDADLGRTIETFTDMGHSRRLGFLGVRDSESSFTELFARLRAERIVP